jgi:hypothetical protein
VVEVGRNLVRPALPVNIPMSHRRVPVLYESHQDGQPLELEGQFLVMQCQELNGAAVQPGSPWSRISSWRPAVRFLRTPTSTDHRWIGRASIALTPAAFPSAAATFTLAEISTS